MRASNRSRIASLKFARFTGPLLLMIGTMNSEVCFRSIPGACVAMLFPFAQIHRANSPELTWLENSEQYEMAEQQASF